MLEKMDAFFAKRLAGYDEHMRTGIEGSGEFYAYTAKLLPADPASKILDLGCGTGLELEDYFAINPRADVTGIDLSADMLHAMAQKFPDKKLELIHGSYFEVPFGNERFHAAVSVESLHHFPAQRKLSLYRRLHAALAPGGYFILTDYFAESGELERQYFESLEQLKRAQNITDHAFYHYDTPLTVEHETEVLKTAGFANVEVLKNWAATYTLRADR